MADSAKNNQATEKKVPFSKGLKAEFKKITWPTKDDLTKQTIAVVVVSVVLGIAITIIDSALQLGLNALIK